MTIQKYLSTDCNYFVTGVLKVAGESKEGVPSPPPNQNDIPDLSESEYLIGGVYPGFKSISGLPKSFLGCMSDIQIAQQGHNPMKGISWGIQPTCSDKVRPTLNNLFLQRIV